MILLEKFLIGSKINSTIFNVLEFIIFFTINILKKDILRKIKNLSTIFKEYLIQEFSYSITMGKLIANIRKNILEIKK